MSGGVWGWGAWGTLPSFRAVDLGLPRAGFEAISNGTAFLVEKYLEELASWGSGICPLAFPWTREEVVNHPRPLIGSLSGPQCFLGTGTLIAEFVLCFHGAGSLPSWLPFIGCFITLELQVIRGDVKYSHLPIRQLEVLRDKISPLF